MKYQKYIGIPYDKANCADLALMIQENEYGKIYDSYERPENKTPFCLSKHLKKNIPNYLEKISLPKDGCAVLLCCRGRLNHIGTYFYINKEHYVIHTSDSFHYSLMTKLYDLKNFNIEIQGFYKWK